MSIREVKVCLLGVSFFYVGCGVFALWIVVTSAHPQDIGVGKSSLVGRFVHNSFNPNLTTTLG